MARRRGNTRRNTLVLLGSLVAHVGVYFLLASEFRFYPPPPEDRAVQVEIVPEEIPPPIPPPPPPIPPKPQVTPQAAPPAPQPQPQPKPAPQLAAKPASAITAPIKAAPSPSPAPIPAPKPAPVPTPLAPPVPAPTPGPPQVVVRAADQASPKTVSTQRLVLHKAQNASPLAPTVSIPGAIVAPTPAPGGGGAVAGGGLPGGSLPGFGSGLRGGMLGCMNAEALNLTPEQKERCSEAYGADTKSAPQMDPIDSSRRGELDSEAARDAAAQKYRDSTPTGTVDAPIAGQPRVEDRPGQ